MSALQCPCGAHITRQSRSGKCQPCAMKAMNADPEFRRRRLEALGHHYDEPGVREATRQRLRAGYVAWRQTMSPEERQRASDHGKRMVRTYLSSPDVRAAAAATRSERRHAWCPEEHRATYRDLTRKKQIPAAEARRMIEQIPGTAEHGHLREAD